MKILRTASLGSNFTGSYKKYCNSSAWAFSYKFTVWIDEQFFQKHLKAASKRVSLLGDCKTIYLGDQIR